MRLQILLAALLGLLVASPLAVDAGCYRGRPRPNRSPSEFYMNHVPAKRLRMEDMPQEFSW